MPKKRTYSPTSDLVIKDIPNPIADLFQRIVNAQSETRNVSEAEIMEEILEREGRRCLGDRGFENALKSKKTADYHTKQYAIKKGWYTPPANE